MQSRNLNLHSMLFLNTKQVRSQQTFCSLYFLLLRQKSLVFLLSSFSYRGISSPIKALASCPSTFSSTCSLEFLFLLWCLGLSRTECSALNITSFVASAWIPFTPKPHEKFQVSPVSHSGYSKFLTS